MTIKTKYQYIYFTLLLRFFDFYSEEVVKLVCIFNQGIIRN
jgi:hypothetical protein